MGSVGGKSNKIFLVLMPSHSLQTFSAVHIPKAQIGISWAEIVKDQAVFCIYIRYDSRGNNFIGIAIFHIAYGFAMATKNVYGFARVANIIKMDAVIGWAENKLKF